MISLTYTLAIDLCVLCVSVVHSTPSPARLYLRIHFTHQTGESQIQEWESERQSFFDCCPRHSFC
ncbi:conserved hypothetical protein [Microcystis aeruginosa PCC 7941]|nr:conserved hypothetical protein [Microcystis aeruginosa PCC 7941]